MRGRRERTGTSFTSETPPISSRTATVSSVGAAIIQPNGGADASGRKFKEGGFLRAPHDVVVKRATT